MFKNYLKVALRNIVKNKISSFINIGGLALGMAVAILIGLWVRDELLFNQYHPHHNRIARVMENRTYNGETSTLWNTPSLLGNALRNAYENDFKHILMSSLPQRVVVSDKEKSLIKTGYYFEPGVTDMLSLRMIKGSRAGLEYPASVLLSASVAKAFFGDADPMGKQIKIENKLDVTVTGVYEDLPLNSDFNDMSFIAPWQLYQNNNAWIRKDSWEQNGFQTYVQIADHADMDKVSARIRDLRLKHVDKEEAKAKPVMFLFPMNKWHLYAGFENGKSVGGRIQLVWLYGIIGFFVLLLACINFMNLATARSEKRAKEVGVRKAIGSLRNQLIGQFFSESILVALLSFVVSLLLVQLMLPFFNGVADKQMVIPWSDPLFWLSGLSFSVFTGLMAGSYPALYLSSFRPVKVLKGTFRAGRFAALPRQVLVVVQFTVSVALIIGVIVVYRQIQVGKNRPVGYDRNGLVMVATPTGEIHEHIDAVRDELKKAGVVTEIAESLNAMTGVSFSMNGFDWTGNGPNMDINFATVWVAHEFGRTVGWQFKEGRDFSSTYATDSSAMVLNETAIKAMGLKAPVGKTIKLTLFGEAKPFKVIGVINDMLMESPYEPVRPSVYMINPGKGNFVNIKIHSAYSAARALQVTETVFKKYSPASPFEFNFVDDAYARKFSDEERIGKLASFFTMLAIFISCLGLFGMASFMSEQRIKEIGVRKVLGASVFHLWRLLSKDFVILVLIALLIAMPLAYYFMHNWLQNYQYRTSISWWIFAAAGAGAILLTLLTVSYQSIKAALANPVKSLRTE
jgi:putative ABC transport system permease protein